MIYYKTSWLSNYTEPGKSQTVNQYQHSMHVQNCDGHNT